MTFVCHYEGAHSRAVGDLLVKFDRVGTVVSDECTACLSCVDACPVTGTLELKSIVNKRTIPKKVVALGVVVMFVLIIGLGMATGNWQNDVDIDEYHHQRLHSYGHPTGAVEISDLNQRVGEPEERRVPSKKDINDE